jgi:hypothetical protein
METMQPMPMGTVAGPPGMMAAPWGQPPRQGSGAILVMFTAVALLMLAGTVVLHARGLIDRPDWNATAEQQQTWQRTMRVMGFVGSLLLDIGVFLSFLFGTLVAVRRHDLPEGVRRAMVIGPAALVAVWLIVAGLFATSSLFFP